MRRAHKKLLSLVLTYYSGIISEQINSTTFTSRTCPPTWLTKKSRPSLVLTAASPPSTEVKTPKTQPKSSTLSASPHRTKMTLIMDAVAPKRLSTSSTERNIRARTSTCNPPSRRKNVKSNLISKHLNIRNRESAATSTSLDLALRPPNKI